MIDGAYYLLMEHLVDADADFVDVCWIKMIDLSTNSYFSFKYFVLRPFLIVSNFFLSLLGKVYPFSFLILEFRLVELAFLHF